VMTPATFTDWATPLVEREERSRVLRARWDKEAAVSRRSVRRT